MQGAPLRPDDIFQLHPSIRWTALISPKGDIVFSQMRGGVKSLMPEEGIGAFLEASRSKTIAQACEAFSMWAGAVDGVLVEYKKIFLYVIKANDDFLAVSLEKGVTNQEILQIKRSLHTAIENPSNRNPTLA